MSRPFLSIIIVKKFFVQIVRCYYMIISGKQIQSVAKVYGDQNQVGKQAKSGKNQYTQQKDEVILSPGVQEFGSMFQKIIGMSEVRADKVSEFSGKIDAGTYVVNSQDIADRMIGRRLAD